LTRPSIISETGHVGHVAYRKPGVGQRPAGAARRDQLDALRGERMREFDEARFVGH
jgi:hypothetical protein